MTDMPYSWVDVARKGENAMARALRVHQVHGYASPRTEAADYVLFKAASEQENALLQRIVPGRYVGWMGFVEPLTGATRRFAGFDSAVTDDGFVRMTLTIRSSAYGRCFRLRIWNTDWIPSPGLKLALGFCAVPTSRALGLPCVEPEKQMTNARVLSFFSNPYVRDRVFSYLTFPVLPLYWLAPTVSDPNEPGSSEHGNYGWMSEERHLRGWFRVQLVSAAAQEVYRTLEQQGL